MKYTYPMIVHSEDGEFWAEFPDMAGCFTDGKTEVELLSNAVEAMTLYLSDRIADGKMLPSPSVIGGNGIKKDCFVVYVSCTLPNRLSAVHTVSDTMEYELQEA